MTDEDVLIKVAEVEHRTKSNTRRIDKLEHQTEAIQSLATSVEILAREQGYQTEAVDRIEKNVEKLDGKVEALEEKPAKRWDGMMDKIVLTAVAAFLGYILAQFGIK